MNTKKYLAIAAIFILVMVTSLIIPDRGTASKCRIIRIQSGHVHGGVRVQPSTIAISKDTCVVWVNGNRNGHARVIFYDRTVSESVANPDGFQLGDSGYVSDWMWRGEASRLTFAKEGVYSYTAKGSGGMSTGVIVVR